jgi:putative phage-type endonuclease
MTGVLIPTATEADWLAARLKGITASEIAVLMGLSPYSSPYKLYHQKLGILPADDDSAVMEKGRVLEPVIAEKFAALHPELSVEGDGRSLFAHPGRPWQLATPDRLTRPRGNRPMDYQCCDWHKPGKALPGGMAACCDANDCGCCCDDCPTCPTNNRLRPTAVLECKVDGGSDEWGEPGTDEIPVHYRAQVLWQCRVMGVRRWHAGCFNADRWQARWYSGEVNDAAEADLKLMEREARDFLDRLDLGDAPDVDWRPATLAALRTMHPDVEDTDVEIRRSLAIQYRAAVKRAREAERRKDEMTARMLAAMGSARRAIEACTDLDGTGGTVIATRSVGHPRRIDTEMLRTRHPVIATECTKPPKPEVKLLPAKPKKDKKHVSPDSE